MPLLVGGLLAACVEPVPTDPAVSLGTGELAFEPLAEGGDLAVVHGPQGGYHVVGSVRARGFDAGDAERLDAPNNPVVAFRTWHGGVDLTLTGAYRQGLDPRTLGIDAPADAEGWTHEMVGRLCILDIPDDDVLVGQEVTFEVEVTDASATVYRDVRTVWIEKDPRNL
jgi:hypothetical protein